MNKKTTIAIVATFFATAAVMLPIGAVLAEKSGSSPESGVTSRIKAVYDSLVTEGHGSESAGSWGDWGAMWNRIRSASEWTPDGTATADDVADGKTFYGSSRTSAVGTARLAQNFELQALVEWDDYSGVDTPGNGSIEDYEGEEAEWTNTYPLDAGEEVWKDERTGLYWSHNLGSYSNSFPDIDHSACPFFDGSTEAEKLAARYGYDGLTSACGNAINACGSLSLKLRETDTEEYTQWYLPTQKELMQAYIDGIYNQTGGGGETGFTTTSWFWSSSEVSFNPTFAWVVHLGYGSTSLGYKTDGNAVRCVARD